MQIKYVKLFLIPLLLLVLSCSGGGDESPKQTSSNQDQSYDEEEVQWQREKIQTITKSGLLTPQVRVKKDISSNLHLTYFSPIDSNHYQIYYDNIDLQSFISESDNALQMGPIVDHCRDLSMVLDVYNEPVIVFQGGAIRTCGSPQQSDVMISFAENSGWVDYTAAIGYVDRNPVIKDGLAGNALSSAVDSTGLIHVCYQFLYEGCDSMNYRYPDLNYVTIQANSPQNMNEPETVEGNSYGNVNIQNRAGDHCKIIIDQYNQPVIFYEAEMPDQTRGLRMARKTNIGWEYQWVETNCKVDYISAAYSDKDDLIAVAYYVSEFDNGSRANCLKYAVEQSGSGDFKVMTVDNNSVCGNFCSLAFDSNGNPGITYYDRKTHSGYDLKNLKFAQYQGITWNKETVNTSQNIGQYNTLFYDGTTAYICTYAESDGGVYLYYQVIE